MPNKQQLFYISTLHFLYGKQFWQMANEKQRIKLIYFRVKEALTCGTILNKNGKMELYKL